MKFEGAPHCSGLRRGLLPRESITVWHEPPALHVDIRCSPGPEGWRPYTGIEHRATESQAGVSSGKPTRRPMKDVRSGPSLREVQFPFPGEDSSSGEFEEAVAWMRDRLDRLVSTVHPRLQQVISERASIPSDLALGRTMMDRKESYRLANAGGCGDGLVELVINPNAVGFVPWRERAELRRDAETQSRAKSTSVGRIRTSGVEALALRTPLIGLASPVAAT